MTLESDIKQKALDLGFDAAGITTAEPIDLVHLSYFQKWLADGNAAEMGYMHRNNEKRFNPGKLLSSAKSVICVALNYRPECGRSFQLRNGKQDACPTLRIARFAQYEDYHPFIKDRLFELAVFIKNSINDADIRFKACVDSVPIADRALAQRAGLGFIGRNHMLINPELGSQILLGELITTLELEADESSEKIPCGDCGRCIRACPTGALGFDGSFDARKCISYQTIEAPGGNADYNIKPPPPLNPLPPSGYSPSLVGGELMDVGRGRANPGYIFGCDECILACPHEMGKPARQNIDFQHHPEWQELTAEQIESMTEEKFQKIFAGSGFIRSGLERLKRNCSEFKL